MHGGELQPSVPCWPCTSPSSTLSVGPCSWTNAELTAPVLTSRFPSLSGTLTHTAIFHHHPTSKHIVTRAGPYGFLSAIISVCKTGPGEPGCRHWGTHESQDISAPTTLCGAERPSEQIEAGGPRSHADACCKYAGREKKASYLFRMLG